MNQNNSNDELQYLINQFKKQFKKNFKGGLSTIILVPIILLVVVGVFTSYYTVQPDEEAVIIRLGRYSGTFGPGLHFKLPYGIDKKIIVKTTKIHQEEFGFRTSGVSRGGRSNYSSGNFDKESLMLTGDLNVADVEWVIQYKVSDPFKYLFHASAPRRNLRDVSESIMRRVVGDQLVNDVLTTGRGAIASEVQILMQEVIDKYDIGIHITAVKLQDVNPPDMVKPSFNEVNEAKQEQEKWINQAEKAYNKVIPEARGRAEEAISKAQGYAQALVNTAQGDAQKFDAILTEYRKAPNITRKRLYIETMEEIFSRFSKLSIVDPKIKGLLPIFKAQGVTQ